MKGRRHSPEQIVRKLREADWLQAEGADVDAVCRHLEVSVQTVWVPETRAPLLRARARSERRSSWRSFEWVASADG
jgi:hypothetical protein